jgi:hypothetical protein
MASNEAFIQVVNRRRRCTMRRMISLLFVVAAIGSTTAGAFVVTNVNDSGTGSLRQAIMDANVASPECEKQTITFAIPGNGTHTIQPLSELPPFNIPIVLDGYSQAGSKANTTNDGTNAVITIELNGSLAGSSSGIVIGYAAPLSGLCGGNDSQIDGVVINRFALAGVDMSEAPCPALYTCDPVGAQIYGSFIGTDTTGTVARPNGMGVHLGLNSKSGIVGEARVGLGGNTTPIPLTRNIISGNTGNGVILESTAADEPSIAHTIRNNLIGVDATGTHALPNGGYGVFADVGSSSEAIQDNIIAAHVSDGVHIVGGSSISVTYNAIGVGIGGVALGNAGDGIHVQGGAKGVTTGFGYPSLSGAGLASIAHNGGAGLYAEDDVNVDVTYGSFGSNGGLGVDLAPRGVNPNDSLDADTGPNELLNAPVLLSANFDASAGPPTTITGTIDTTVNTQNEIDFYVSESCDPSGYGEGEGYLGFVNATTDASGHAQFSQSFYVQPGLAVTALTRRFSTTDPGLIVSEFSNCRVVGDEIFANGFGP